MYLTEGLTVLSATETRTTNLIAPDYEVDEDGLFFFCPRSTSTDKLTGMMRLVIPELLQKDFPHHSSLVWKADITGSAGLTSGSLFFY